MKTAYNRVEIEVGSQFGEWTVLEQKSTKDSKGRYISILRVQYSCGLVKEVRKSGIVDGRSKSCRQCSSRRKNKNPGYGELGGSVIWHLKKGAKKRNLSWELTPEFLWNLFLEQDQRCALTGVDLHMQRIRTSKITASLDRIDNERGYEKGNVRWVHKRINVMRMDMNDAELLKWSRLLMEYNKT